MCAALSKPHGKNIACEISVQGFKKRRSEIFSASCWQGLEPHYQLPNCLLPGAKIGLGRTWSVGSRPAPLMPELLHLEDLEMRIDLSPYRRSTVGFDRLFNLLETGNVADAAEGYPPFDIVRDGDDSYRITLAVAGFRPDEIEIVAQQNQLSVSGKKADEKQDAQYIHRGIATRSFDRRFQLADFVEVRGANFQDGLLSISLQRVVPEAMKPRKIEIGGTSSQEQIEHRDAA
jgi:Molecular chaperone (small heat shock protein)